MVGRKEFGALQKQAMSQGWIISRTKHGYKWTAPNGKSIFTGASPSDRRAIKNHVAYLKKLGFKEAA